MDINRSDYRIDSERRRLEGHVRGVACIGSTARYILNELPSRCMINVADFDMWSCHPKLFANAVLCGITGRDYQYNKVDGLTDYLEAAEALGIVFAIDEKYFPMAQKYSLNILMSGKSGRELDITGISLGLSLIHI